MARHIALLLIHGMGEQKPFGLTDMFARNLVDRFRPDSTVKTYHHIEPGDIGEPPSSFLRLEIEGNRNEGMAGENEIDVVDLHEVYWADKPQGLIKLKEVGKWLWWTSLTPLRRWPQNASLFHNRGRSRSSIAGVRRFLSEVTLALVLPVLGVVLLLFALNSAFLTDAYLRSVRKGLMEAHLSGWTYLLGVVWLFAVVGGLFLIYGGLRTRSAVRYEGTLTESASGRSDSAGLEANGATEALGPQGRWRWMKNWATSSVVFGIVLLIGSWQVYEQTSVEELVPIVLRLDGESFSRVMWAAVWLTLTASVFVLLINVLWRLPWKGWRIGVRIFGAIAGLVGVVAVITVLIRQWEQPAKLVFWAALIGGVVVLSKFLVASIGDVAIYFDGIDERSKHYQTRQSIISAVTRKLAKLLKSDNQVEVFIAAHSLGSVIAYDAINRLATYRRVALEDGSESPLSKEDFDRLHGFYSFGSPLDKVVYLFHKTTESRTPVLSQIHSSLTSFMRRSSGRPYGPYEFERYAPQTPENFRWRNAWSWGDVLGHRLDFYQVSSQRHFDYVPISAHSAFWTDEEFYGDLANFLEGPPRGAPET